MSLLLEAFQYLPLSFRVKAKNVTSVLLRPLGFQFTPPLPTARFHAPPRLLLLSLSPPAP